MSSSSSPSLYEKGVQFNNNNDREIILSSTDDDHGGVIVEINTPINQDSNIFTSLLRASLSHWKQQVQFPLLSLTYRIEFYNNVGPWLRKVSWSLNLLTYYICFFLFLKSNNNYSCTELLDQHFCRVRRVFGSNCLYILQILLNLSLRWLYARFYIIY